MRIRVAFALALAAAGVSRAEGLEMPQVGCWFWHEEEFAPRGYQPFLDLIAGHAGYDLLTTSLRVPRREVTDDAVRAQIREAAEYARRRGIGLVVDLDVRLARSTFREAHPEEMQEMLRLREVDFGEAGEALIRIAPEMPNDHYTVRTTPYIPLAGRLVRIYTYARGADGIDPGTIREVPRAACAIREESEKAVAVAIPRGPDEKGRTACAIAAFAHLTPDVFAPHLVEFQRRIIESYRDAGLAGACKDEWGFPPCYDGCPAKDDYWYSEARAAAYAERTGGRDLVRDCLLMTYGERGGEARRQAAINRFLAMSRERNSALEDDFFRAVKEILGAGAFVGTHPTWYPYPGRREFKKNGLDWWGATRDVAQTDEVTPYAARTSLAKKWGSPIWVNMYYSDRIADYHREIWAHALAGGRMNVHPLFPWPQAPGWTHAELLRGGMTCGACRIHLLDAISSSPLDCPVAVIFGQAAAMNWAGPNYDDVGLGVADALWAAGYPTDLIPSTEIRGETLRVRDGAIWFGPQRYAAAVLHRPEFEGPATARFFRDAARETSHPGGTWLCRIGGWTRDFEGRPFDGAAALPPAILEMPDPAACVRAVLDRLRTLGIEPQTPATGTVERFDHRCVALPARGRCRLIDGTEIILSGADDAAGDPIRETIRIRGQEVAFDVIGVAAVRIGGGGRLEALAAGGLRRFRGGGLDIALEEQADIALRRGADGAWRGIIQGWTGEIPASLAAITSDWTRRSVPSPLSP
ncbi:MAG: hypothetical protein JXP34_17045 [Planctomycetes bacterium]|nr:hypothetical protein [Planctomycetota bacterium]